MKKLFFTLLFVTFIFIYKKQEHPKQIPQKLDNKISTHQNKIAKEIKKITPNKTSKKLIDNIKQETIEKMPQDGRIFLGNVVEKLGEKKSRTLSKFKVVMIINDVETSHTELVDDKTKEVVYTFNGSVLENRPKGELYAHQP